MLNSTSSSFSASVCGPVGRVKSVRLVLLFGVFAGSVFGEPLVTREQVEADWDLQDTKRGIIRSAAPKGIVPPEDAAGGCDGHKDGKWGFHTEDQQNPWWQVDLGRERKLDHLLLYNRCDECGARNSRIRVLFSDDGKSFSQVYQHNGKVFYGFTDKKPLRVDLGGAPIRFVRLQLSGKSYFHLDEVEVFEAGNPKNIALNRPANQSSTSRWSTRSATTSSDGGVAPAGPQVVRRGRRLLRHLASAGAGVAALQERFDELAASKNDARAVRHVVREAAFKNPLLDFEDILFVKRAPTLLPHLSDQYYGWWARPGGGLFILEDFKTDAARLVCLTSDWAPGNFLRPELSYDGKRVLFAYAKHYPHVAGVKDKVNKDNLPEDAFYHLYEMKLDGSEVRRLTRGKYDDFDGRYLPDGDIVFLSTRKGQFLQCSKANTARTLATPDLPDSYVRCGGDTQGAAAYEQAVPRGLAGGNGQIHPWNRARGEGWLRLFPGPFRGARLLSGAQRRGQGGADHAVPHLRPAGPNPVLHRMP